MKLSVILPYYNRRTLIQNVLKSFNRKYSVEVIIVDDGSNKENQLDDLIDEYDFTLIKLPESLWNVPTTAYNLGFAHATGDVIMINSSECIHVGDVIGYVNKKLKPKEYMAFSACMGEPGIEYDYIFNSIDPDGNEVKYIINWGDNTSDKTDFILSGTDVTVSHTWTSKGKYTITAKAEDEMGLISPEATKAITIPRDKALFTLQPILIRLFEQLPYAFPILRHLMGL